MENGPGSGDLQTISGQKCPMCQTDNLALLEHNREVPYFGRVFMFSMTCSNCKYHVVDVEAQDKGEPAKYTLDVSEVDDLNIRVIKSSTAVVRIPRITTITPGPVSNGYITTVEGILKRVQKQIEDVRDNEEDPAAKKKAKSLIKKLTRVMWGKESLKIIIEDINGNSAIVSEKAVKTKI
ncbi:MAG: ZPR1 zinc finger domain-containing protein [archaeon]